MAHDIPREEGVWECGKLERMSVTREWSTRSRIQFSWISTSRDGSETRVVVEILLSENLSQRSSTRFRVLLMSCSYASYAKEKLWTHFSKQRRISRVVHLYVHLPTPGFPSTERRGPGPSTGPKIKPENVMQNMYVPERHTPTTAERYAYVERRNSAILEWRSRSHQAFSRHLETCRRPRFSCIP